MRDMRHFRDQAGHKRNGSPQFPDDGLDAHVVHSGRKGGDKINHKDGAAIGYALLDNLKAGELEITSVEPKDYASAAKLQSLVDGVNDGTIKQTRVETASIAEEGHPRRKRLSVDMTGGPIPRIDITYKLPSRGR